MKSLARLIQLFVGAAILFPLVLAAAGPDEPPVELLSSGVPPGKAKIAFKIKVNTDKPINEVHLNLKETGADGKVVTDTMLVWANIVHSTRQPIEQGKTYEDDFALSPGAVAAECSLKEVVYKDSTRWSAPAVSAMRPSPPPKSATTEPGIPPPPKRAENSPEAKAPKTVSVNEGAEGFIKSLYHDMEQDDVDKVLAYFDETVDYYAYGPKSKAFIGEKLLQYFATFPIRSFSVSEVKFQASSRNKASATCEVRYSLQNSPQGPTSTGRSHVEFELVKRNGVPKITRFAGTSTPD
jgi:hypothetical protein